LREIPAEKVTQAVAQLAVEANCFISEDVLSALEQALLIEESPLGQKVLAQLLDNDRLARETEAPICQDTGLAIIFVELGQDVHLTGGTLEDAVNEGVRQGYLRGSLRGSVVSDPLLRQNTGDNTPAIIHIMPVRGEKIKITLMAKGAGSENMSALKMLSPSAGVDGIKDFIVSAVQAAGANPCPPIIVGIGIGGDLETVALAAKKALLRPLNSIIPQPHLAQLEKELLKELNDLGIGPGGLGGRVSALAVHVEALPCHIASLPVAVNIECHASRHKSITL